MTQDFTPGPWVVKGETDVNNRRTIYSSYAPCSGDPLHEVTGRGICLVGFLDTDPVEDDANAHLIAAAPDLLEALKAAVDYMNGYGMLDAEQPILDGALAAIAKAKGEQA